MFPKMFKKMLQNHNFDSLKQERCLVLAFNEGKPNQRLSVGFWETQTAFFSTSCHFINQIII